MQVFTADEVTSQLAVKHNGKQVKGPKGNGRAALIPEKNILKIYLAAKSDFEEE